MIIKIDFDESTKTIRSVSVDEATKTVRKKKEVIEKDQTPILKVEDNKLVLNKALVDFLSLEVGNRVMIKYQDINGFITPIIGTDESFSEKGGGNKLTKSLTVAFRGSQRDTLAKYGEQFEVEQYQNVVRLVSEVKVEAKPQPTPITDLPEEIASIIASSEDSLDIKEPLFTFK